MRARGTGGLIRVPGSRFWYLLYWVNGRQIRESSRTTSKMQAQALLQRRLGEKAIGIQPASDVAKLRYDDLRSSLIQEYKINARKSRYRPADGNPYLTSANYLDKFFGGQKVNRITADEIRKFVLARRAAGASNGTINRSLAALRKMFNLAIRDGKLQTAPHFEMLKESSPRKGFLEFAEFRRLRQEPPEHLRPVITLAFYTGMRLGEIRNLKWESANLAKRMIRLNPGETKNNEPRIIPLNTEIAEMLKMLRGAKTGSVYVFGNERPLGQFRKAWRSACLRAGKIHGTDIYNRLLFHDLRRSGVRNLVRAGVVEGVAMAISGHKTRSTFERYNMVSERDLSDASRKLDAYFAEDDESLMTFSVASQISH